MLRPILLLASLAQPLTVCACRSVVRCVTAALPNQWMSVDLLDKSMQVCRRRRRPHKSSAQLTHYTLRHYNSWDTEALRQALGWRLFSVDAMVCCRHWVLEASNDDSKWVTLRVHENDFALDKKGATFTWPVNSGNNRTACHRRAAAPD